MDKQVMQKGDLCLITGISGYLASWIATYLLEEGFRVRGTVRSVRNAEQQTKLQQLLPGAEYVEADLRSDEGWDKAVEGVKWVFHVATPQAVATEKNRTEGATSGTKYLMTAALNTTTVEKIVVTSSEAAIAYGHPSSKTDFSEDDWSVVESCGDYFRSKTLAERLAWDLVRDKTANPRGIILSTINPGLILGPSLVPWARYSLESIQKIAEGKMPMLPDMLVHFVDVRDCAAMHIAIMKDRSTDGNRHLSFKAYAKYVELARLIKANYADQGYNPSVRTAPNFLLWVTKFFNEDAKSIYGKLGNEKPYTTKYPDVYKYQYTDLEALVKASMDSLFEHKILVPSK